MVWEPIKEDEAPGVDEVIELAVRLEDRLRAGEKVGTLRLFVPYHFGVSHQSASVAS